MRKLEERKEQRNDVESTKGMGLYARFQATPYTGLIHYSLGTDKYDNHPKQCSAESWGDFYKAIDSNRSKMKGEGWICPAMGLGLNNKPKKYKGEAHWRQAHLAQPTPFLEVDCDGMPPAVLKPLLFALNKFSGCSYTTASFTDQNPRIRAVVALSRLVDYSERICVGKAFERLLEGQGISRVKFDPSVYFSAQPCYLPLRDAHFITHESTMALNVNALLSSDYSQPEDANGSQPSEAVEGLFNDLPHDEQHDLVVEIESQRAEVKEAARAANWDYKNPKVVEAQTELERLGAGLINCWVFSDTALQALCEDLTKDDVNNLTRNQWVGVVVGAARYAPLGSVEAETIKTSVQAWSEQHNCYEGYVTQGNEHQEFEQFGGKDDPFTDFQNRWDEGERTANLSNSPFKKFSYMKNNNRPTPHLLMADGSTYDIFDVRSGVGEQEVIPTSDKETYSPMSLEDLFQDELLRQADVDAMDDAEIISPDLIVKGHVQAIVSPANGGKTTIMVYVCEKLVSAGMEVFYINVDGSPGDLKRHHAHAKKHGYEVLAPDARQGGSIQSVHNKLHTLLNANIKLSNTVFVFDTLKKFVQVIDKSKAAAFFKLTRALSVKGATVILLGHTNKHAGVDGQQVFEGTADLRNDVDELIYLDCYKNEAEGVLEVTTRPDKVRADLKPKTFIIDLKNNRKVSELGYTKNIIAKEERQVLELFKAGIISGLHSQKELLEYAEPKTTEGKPKLRKMLIKFTQWDAPEIVATNTGRGKDLRYALAGV